MQTLIDLGELQTTRGKGNRPMTKLSEYVKTAEAAEILGVAQNTLRKWAERGDIPMHRNPANGYRLFKRSDLNRFLKKTAKPVKPKS
ncbi:helix-turn-helix domain-containing protein [Roseiconus lacunae]|uniref:MerR family transcriptional regulator n=1 Tax=Roseiconus lacunae TaxID=2605694 RepID=UPI002AA54E65